MARMTQVRPAAILLAAGLLILALQPIRSQLSSRCRTQATGGNCPPDAPCPQPCLPSVALDNIEIFSGRDFVSIVDYSAFAGQTATVHVFHETSPGTWTVAGAAKGIITGGEVAFEVNHPGEYCWGAGFEGNQALQVTPDIVFGDVVRLTLPNGVINEVTATRAEATSVVLDGTVLTVKGYAGASIAESSFISITIINPDLRDTAVARRVVEAAAISATPVLDDGGTYSYVWTFDEGFEGEPDRPWTAVFTFNDPDIAAMAAHPLDMDITSWADQDAAGNIIGGNHAEFFSFGGPQFGGCPFSPADKPLPTGYWIESKHVMASDESTPCDGTSTPGVLKVLFDPASPASEVGGYVVAAVFTNTATGTGSFARVLGSGANSGTVPNVPCDATYKTEVRAFGPSSTLLDLQGLSKVFPQYVPTLSVSVPPGLDPSTPASAQSIELSTNLESNTICYILTEDGSEPAELTGPENVTASQCTIYDGPIQIPDGGVVGLKAIVVTTVGPLFKVLSPFGYYSKTAAPPAPTDVTAAPTTSIASGAIRVTWQAPSTGPTAATSFVISARTEAGAAVPEEQLGIAATQPGTARSSVITVLPPGVVYFFTVTAVNAGGSSPPSADSNGALMTDLVTIDAGFPMYDTRKRQLQIRGTSSSQTTTLRVFTTNSLSDPFQLDITGACGATCNVVAGAYRIRYTIPAGVAMRTYITVRSMLQGFVTQPVLLDNRRRLHRLA